MLRALRETARNNRASGLDHVHPGGVSLSLLPAAYRRQRAVGFAAMNPERSSEPAVKM